MLKNEIKIAGNNLILISVGYYFLTILLTFVVLSLVAGLFSVDWSIPFSYGGDPSSYLISIKALISGEWFPFISNIKSGFLAAPFGLEMGSWLYADGLFYVIMKCLSFVFDDYVVVYNVYFVLTFFLSSLLFVFAARQLKISFPVAMVCGVLFAFLPYHFERLCHLFLASYFMIPLMVVVLLWIWNSVPVFFVKKGDDLKFSLMNYRSIFSIIVLTISAWSGIYYVFFFCFFAVIMGLGSYFYNDRKFKYLISGFTALVFVLLAFILNFLPNFIYFLQEGGGFSFERVPIEAEMFGLRLMTLFMPTVFHRINALTGPMANYLTYPHYEIIGSYLGVFAGFAVLFLIFRMLFFKKNNTYLDGLSLMTVSGILLATVSGFGLIFNYLVSPDIRSYSRIVMFLAVFGLFTVAIFLNKWLKKMEKDSVFLILFMVLAVGIFDQTNDAYKFTQPQRDEFVSDSKFIEQVENIVKPEGMIFQLPFSFFPEAPPVVDMSDYSHFKGALHSDTLKWTYGAVGRTPEAEWYVNMANLSLEELVFRLVILDFEGIYVDRYGYEDRGTDLESRLIFIIGEQPIVSSDNRLSFFNFGAFKKNLLAQYSLEQLESMRVQFLSFNTN